jgi:Flp pilus assembly protein TadG
MARPRAKTSSGNRAGAAIVELALTLPIILFLLTCLLEFSRALMLKQTVDSAAYEGARAAVVVGSTPQAARDSVDALMKATRLKQWVTDIDPLVFDNQTSTVSVRVAVSVADNSWITPFFFQGRIISSTVTLLTERPPAVQLTGIPKLNQNNLSSILPPLSLPLALP